MKGLDRQAREGLSGGEVHLAEAIREGDRIVMEIIALERIVLKSGERDSSGRLTAQAYHLYRLRGINPTNRVTRLYVGIPDPCAVEARGEEIRSF